jgi:hypothetical protein
MTLPLASICDDLDMVVLVLIENDNPFARQGRRCRATRATADGRRFLIFSGSKNTPMEQTGQYAVKLHNPVEATIC